MAQLILILNGPNLNMLGTREPEIYGSQTLADIEALCVTKAKSLGLSVDFRQSNSEAEMVDWTQASLGVAAGLIVNAGALTHTSVALLDALLAAELPVVEVHLSNTAGRERFRRHSYLAPVASGVVLGFGVQSYLLGLRGLVARARG